MQSNSYQDSGKSQKERLKSMKANKPVPIIWSNKKEENAGRRPENVTEERCHVIRNPWQFQVQLGPTVIASSPG